MVAILTLNLAAPGSNPAAADIISLVHTHTMTLTVR